MIKFKALILDMDGVLWRGDQPIGDLPAIFKRFDQRGMKVILATNNSTLSVAQYRQKLLNFGVHLQSEQVITSSEATAQYLQRLYPQGGLVFSIGEIGLQQALAERGFLPAEPGSASDQVLAVVAGMDRGLTYEKLSQATLYIRAGVPFIGTNPDRTFPVPQGLVPGAGAILALLEAATEVKPNIIGKPAIEMYRVALERLKSSTLETLVVGDRLETDIAGAQLLGCRTALVLSGVSTLPQAKAWKPEPDWIVSDLATLLEII